MHAELKSHNGARTLFINGEPKPLVGFKPTELPDEELFRETVDRSVADMAERGVEVFYVPVFFKWHGPGDYDFTCLDNRIRRVLRNAPEGWIVIRIQAESMNPQWWKDENPGGTVRFSFDSEKFLPKADHQTPGCPSIGSTFWEDAGLPALKALAHHVRRQDYTERIIGYLPTAYNSNEWFYRSYDELQVHGFSAAMQKNFSEWLKENYGIEREEPVPGRGDRHDGDKVWIFEPDPRRSKAPVTAFYRYVNERTARVIMDITRTLREAYGEDRILVGTFYGYLMGLSNFYWLPDSGHLDLARLLRAEGPDFTCSPLEYFTRNSREPRGGGFCWGQSPAVDAARLAGKTYIGEDDFVPRMKEEKDMIGWSGAADPAEDAELQKRNFVFSLCKGSLQWWYDLHGHWYEGEERLEMVRTCTRVAREALERDRSPVAEVAVIMSEKSPMSLQLDIRTQRAIFWENFYHTFDRVGAPVDVLLTSSLKDADMDRYKVLFLPNCFALTREERGHIERLKADNRTLVFYQFDGLIDLDADPSESAIRPDSVSDLCGIKVSETACMIQMRATMRTDHELVRGIEDEVYGAHLEKGFNLLVDDEDATPLGHIGGRNATALAIRDFDDWTSVYSSIPALPSRFAHNLLRRAGVHLYLEDPDDIVYACASYVGVFTRKGGVKTVRLPRPMKVRDPLNDRVIRAEPTGEITWQAEPYTTYLFELS